MSTTSFTFASLPVCQFASSLLFKSCKSDNIFIVESCLQDVKTKVTRELIDLISSFFYLDVSRNPEKVTETGLVRLRLFSFALFSCVRCLCKLSFSCVCFFLNFANEFVCHVKGKVNDDVRNTNVVWPFIAHSVKFYVRILNRETLIFFIILLFIIRDFQLRACSSEQH